MLNPIVNYLKESRAELNKVSWPKREEVVRLTLVVLAVSLLTAFYLGLLDSLLLKATEFIVANKK